MRYGLKAIIILIILTIFTGCQSTIDNSDSRDKLNVVATIFPQYDFVRQIAGDNINLSMLLPPGSESHSYEPSPQDIIKIKNCDMFIYVGGASDAWVDKILESIDTQSIKIVSLMDLVEAVEEKIVEGMEADHDHGHDHEEEEHEYDEHVWTSPKNAMIITEKISEMLCLMDSENSEIFKKNTQAYLDKLAVLDSEFEKTVNGAEQKTIVFGDRFPFRYFADAYGLEYFAAFPGCSTETEASAATVAFLIDKIKAEKIPAVFHVELSNKKMANTISEATGAKVLLFHACHNITRDEMSAGVGYIDFMNGNLESLKEAIY